MKPISGKEDWGRGLALFEYGENLFLDTVAMYLVVIPDLFITQKIKYPFHILQMGKDFRLTFL